MLCAEQTCHFGISEVSWFDSVHCLLPSTYMFYMFNGMYCTCYCCLIIVVLPSLLCCRCLRFAPWFPLDYFRSYLSHRVVACFSLCTRNSFFRLVPVYALVSISLRSSVSFRDESHPKLHLTPPPAPPRPTPSRPREIHVRLPLEARSKSITNPVRSDP